MGLMTKRQLNTIQIHKNSIVFNVEDRQDFTWKNCNCGFTPHEVIFAFVVPQK